jgi:hypothetical protein
MHSVRTLGKPRMGEEKIFTPKYIIVGVEAGGIINLLRVQSNSFGHKGPLAQFQNRCFQPPELFLVSDEQD